MFKLVAFHGISSLYKPKIIFINLGEKLNTFLGQNHKALEY